MSDQTEYTDTVALHFNEGYPGGFQPLELRSYEERKADVTAWALADMLVKGQAVVGKAAYTKTDMSFDDWQSLMTQEPRWNGWRAAKPAIHTTYRYQSESEYIWTTAQPAYSGPIGTLSVYTYTLRKENAIGAKADV